MIHDVIIAGSGPAGSIAAYLLARAGLDVLLLEKESLPRYKACGGGLPRKAQALIPFSVTHALEFQSAGGVVAYDGKSVFRTRTLKPYAALVMRDKFDHYLVRKAEAEGAIVRDVCRVTGVELLSEGVRVRSSQGEDQARVLVGADGINSVVAHLTGIIGKRRAGSALEAEVTVPLAALEDQGTYATFDFGAISHGYGWIFPKADHFSVGIFNASDAKEPQLRKILERYLERQPHIASYEIQRIRGHRIPLGGAKEVLHLGGRVMVAGDAANMADPFLGEGIHYALWSGTIAAETILAQWNHATLDFEAYTRRIWEEILPHFQYAQRIANVMYRHPKLATNMLHRSKRMQDVMFGVISGEHTYRDLYRAITWEAPLLLGEVIFKPYRGGGI
jgi:geranylgeranyl reductase family protein